MIGNGKNKKSMAYVQNVAAFLEYSMSFKPGLHIYNYIDKPDFEMNDLVYFVQKRLSPKNKIIFRLPRFLGILLGYIGDFVANLTGTSVPITSIRIKKFLATTQFSSSVRKTGFVAPVSLEEGLNRTLTNEFLKDNSEKSF